MQEKIQVNELVEEMKVALRDEFVAQVTAEGAEITLRFANGQAFRVRVEEVE